jgi:hypothetical protein
MAKRRDAAWKRLQLWLRLSEQLRRKVDFRGDIDRACRAFDLDPEKQADRELLLGVLARVHFPQSGALTARPRKKEWTADRIARLRDHVDQVKGASLRTNLPVDQTKIAEFLKYQWPDCWNTFNTETLKRKIRAYARGYY